jgi:2-polyprenyl-3-methyl-5-hydroxy-6-metoxy-1,4-benzoquinol methylase
MNMKYIEHYDEITNYDAFAEDYVIHMANKSEVEICDRALFRSLLMNIKDKHVLDVGCGSGYYSEYCIRSGSFVTAVDYSGKILDRRPRTCISRPVPAEGLPYIPNELRSNYSSIRF